MAVAGIYIFFHLPFFSIKNIQMLGDADPGTTARLNELSGVSIFSQEVSRKISQIKEDNLLIAGLSCSRGVPNTLRCTVSLRKPSLLWRQAGKLYLVDENGFIYGNTSIADSTLLIEDRTTSALGLGKTVVTQDIITAYYSMRNELVARGFTVTNLYIADTLYQVGAVVTANSNANWHPKTPINFLMVTSYPINTQGDILLTTVKEKMDKITEHIDVRVPGYVYIK